MLGIPTFEDKVAQRAVTMVLEEIYEQDFLSCSFGFRRGRSAHQAIRTLQNVLWAKRLYWVLEIDIRKYFDSIPHSHLRVFLDQRVTDGVIRRMIDKWLKAGAVEDGLLHHATEGTPQGGVISPCLSNVFLHHVLDEWFETEVKPRLRGECTLVRFADDALMAFDNIVDAKRVLSVLGKRLARYGLTLHPDKTRLVEEFGRALAESGTRVLFAAAGGPGAPPFAAWERLLRQRFGLVPSMAPEIGRARLAAAVSELIPGARSLEVTHLVAQLIGLPYPDAPVVEPLAETPAQLEARTFIALKRLVAADAARAPLCIAIHAVERDVRVPARADCPACGVAPEAALRHP